MPDRTSVIGVRCGKLREDHHWSSPRLMLVANQRLLGGVTTATGAPGTNRWPPVHLYGAAMQGDPARRDTQHSRARAPVQSRNDISGGRLIVNIVAGWNKLEYSQMGLWPGDAYYGCRYDYATEYVEILRRLWDESRLTFNGRYFQFEDCVCLTGRLTAQTADPAFPRPALSQRKW